MKNKEQNIKTRTGICDFAEYLIGINYLWHLDSDIACLLYLV
jgi:hypothetical protein